MMIDPKQWFHFAKTVKAEDINTNWQIRNCNLALLEKMHGKFIEIPLEIRIHFLKVEPMKNV